MLGTLSMRISDLCNEFRMWKSPLICTGPPHAMCGEQLLVLLSHARIEGNFQLAITKTVCTESTSYLCIVVIVQGSHLLIAATYSTSSKSMEKLHKSMLHPL